MQRLSLALAASLVASGALGVNLSAPLVPDPVKTPRAVLTSDPRIICVSGYTSTVRNVPQSLKEQVYRSYGITSRESGEYEIDHLVSLELGGSNSVRNLWPESYKTMPLNAHVKDSLENRLHAGACSGKITLQEAQQAVSSNWTAAYVKYVGPLPGGASVSQTAGSTTATQTPVPAPSLPPVQTPAVQTVPTSGSTPPGPGGSCPASAPIKGNVGQDRIYHLPGDPSYTRTKAEACFSSAQAAQAAGFRGIR